MLQPGDTVVVAFLDRFSRNFEEGVRIQADLTRRDIGIVAVRENIDTREGSAAAKFFRRSMLAQGAYQVDSASETDQAWFGAGPGRGKTGGQAAGPQRRAEGAVPAHGGGGSGVAADCPGAGLLSGNSKEGAGHRPDWLSDSWPLIAMPFQEMPPRIAP